jgi:hypothetical protein
MSPVARARVLVARAVARVALAGVLAAPAVPAARVDLVAPAAARVEPADPPDLSARSGRSATRSSSPTPCASSPT